MQKQIQISRVEDISRQVISLCDSSLPGPTVDQWVNEVYRDLVSRYKAQHLRDVFQQYLPAPMVTGTVSVTYDSPFITPDSDAQSAWLNYSVGGGPGAPAQVVGPQGFVGWFFRLFNGRVWYKVIGIDPITGLMQLDNPYSQDTNGIASGSTVTDNSYYLLPRYINLDPRVRFLGTVVMDSWYRELPVVSLTELDIYAPSRWLVAFPPKVLAIIGKDLEATGQPLKVEPYPYPQVSTNIHYVGYKNPPYLESSDPLPPVIDDAVLLDGVLAKAYRWMAFQTGNPRNKSLFSIEAAAMWRNEANSQRTQWERIWSRAARADRGTDDITMLLRSGRWNRGPNDYDPVTSAQQQWLAGGPFVISG